MNLMSKKKAKITEYNEKVQPKNEKGALSFILALFFSFNLFFFGPLDFYLSNIESLMLPRSLIFKAIIPVSVIAVVIVFLVCFLTKGKAHIIVCSLVFGFGIALYIQGNYLSISLGKLDGRDNAVSVFRCVINILIWLAVISVPFLIFRFRKSSYKNMLGFLSAAVILIEIITIAASFLRIEIYDESARLNNSVAGKKAKIVSMNNEYVFSKEKNYIIIIADEYDSFCFDYALKTEPDCVSGFDGFTYYSNTVGMYQISANAIPYLLTGEETTKPTYEGRDDLFKAIKNNYEMNIYATDALFSDKIYRDYSNNMVAKKIDLDAVINTEKIFYKVTFLKYLPEAFRPLFFVYTDDFNNVFADMQSYYPDNLSFYNNITSNITYSDEPQFKLIYLFGLHDPRSVSADLKRVPNWSVSGDEEAIAVNKILSKYFDALKKNGVYDNTEIILMADHGLKEHESGAYPLLMIKRAGADFEGIQTTYAPISQGDVYPTLMMIAGEDTGRETVFDIDENADRKRYFAQKDKYFEGNVKE